MLFRTPSIPATLVREFIRPAVRAVPSSMAQRLGRCRISLPAEVEPGVASRWTTTDCRLEIAVTTDEVEEHDVAMEMLLCLGQALWERLSGGELRAYWIILGDEVNKGIDGEIDQQALEEKLKLFEGPSHTSNPKGLERYGRASFAGTAAEYVHCLWHEVSVQTGPEHLPAAQLRRRLKLLERWFRPNPGYRLFPAAPPRTESRRSPP